MTPPAAERPRLPGPFWRLAGAAGVNAVGEGAFAAAVPLLAATLTDDARLVSAVTAATYLPWLLLSLPAGVLVDRHDRAGLTWRAQAIQALLVGGVAVLAGTGRLGVAALALLAFALGACQVVAGTAAQALLPDLVAGPLLHRANGYHQTVVTVGQQFVGPPVGSLLFAVAVALPFGVDAAALAVSALLLATLRRPTAARTGSPGRGGHPPVRTAIADGLRWLARHRLLRTLAVLLALNTFCFALATATLVLLATQTLGLNARGYGLLLAAAAVGSVLGGLTSSRVIAVVGVRGALFGSLGTNAVAFAGIGLSPDPRVLGALLGVTGFATTLWNVVTVSLRQRLVPSDLLGRVTGVYRMVGWGLTPLGALTGGFVAHLLGLRAPYLVAAAVRAIALLVTAPVLLRALRDPP
ncbi:MFS transporter [Jiangella asiatica]|uniref:MFS transporter n=1 Tax=Jiangella asiatica TaxID=2530372 RepID=A0A4R5CID5_9ACTN|nr:MFS transporter [Jiangella asiatica]TDD98866.1 MFS transporter [Jiangella asiatica]